jgi:hypothetical protein
LRRSSVVTDGKRETLFLKSYQTKQWRVRNVRR